MKRAIDRLVWKRTPGRCRLCGGFTLTEVMVAAAIGSVVCLISMGAMVEGMHLFKTNSTEMIARDLGSRAIRKMSADIQQATKAKIFPNYQGTTGAEGQYGSCIVLQTFSGGSVAYYRYAPTDNPNSGGIYYASNAILGLNPLTDKPLVNVVQDLEFRRDANGSVRIGFDIGTFNYSTLVVGGKETDLVRFTTSSLPRN